MALMNKQIVEHFFQLAAHGDGARAIGYPAQRAAVFQAYRLTSDRARLTSVARTKGRSHCALVEIGVAGPVAPVPF